MLKRAGRSYESGGVRDIADGGLCVRCPACPTPGVNLPPNWDMVTPDLRYVYCMQQDGAKLTLTIIDTSTPSLLQSMQTFV